MNEDMNTILKTLNTHFICSDENSKELWTFIQKNIEKKEDKRNFIYCRNL